AAIYCPKCSTDKTLIWPKFEDTFDAETKTPVLRKFKEHFDVILEVVLVGRFDTTGGGHLGAYPYLFHIMRAEQAKAISMHGYNRWNLPEKLKRRIRC